MNIDGPVLSFAPFRNVNCPQGFLYFNKQVWYLEDGNMMNNFSSKYFRVEVLLRNNNQKVCDFGDEMIR